MAVPHSYTEFLIHGYNRIYFESITNISVPSDIKCICCHYFGYKMCCIALKIRNNSPKAYQLMDYHDHDIQFHEHSIQHWITNILHFPENHAKE